MWESDNDNLHCAGVHAAWILRVFSGCLRAAWCRLCRPAAADWKKQVKSCSSLCCYKRKRKKALSNLAWIDVLKQIAKYNNTCCAWQQNSIKVFQQYLQFIGQMDDQSNIFKILVQTLHPLQVRAGTWQLFLFFYFFFIPNAEKMIRTWNWEALKCRCSLADEIKGNTVQTCVCLRFNRCG